MKATFELAIATLVLATAGCNRRGGEAAGEQPSPSASVISIGVEMGGCEDDITACQNECEAGSSDRCRRIGVSYEFGKGVARDPVRATDLYVRACSMNNAEGCLSAGRMYEFHHGVDKDDVKAVGFYGRACDLGNPTGCANLAIMLESGKGTSKNEGAALRLFDQACAKGAGLACDHARHLRAADAG